MRIHTPRISTKKMTFLLGLVAFGLGVAGVFVRTPLVMAADCDNNAIMWCGFSSSSDFITKVRANDDGKGHHDLQSVYAHYSLSSGDYGRFQSSAADGTMYRDGHVTVGSQTVMNSGKTLGRENFPGSTPVSIGGKTYYSGVPDVRWAPGTNSIPVKVLFDANGTAEFVVLTSCGNPVGGNPVASGASCKLLSKAAVPGKLNTYRFSASASTIGNAKITKYVFDFGDGSKPVTTTSATETVEHTYTYSGKDSYTASLTVYASTPGGTTIQATSENCKTKIDMIAPYYECVKLEAALLTERDKYTYTYTATMRYGNGAQFTSATFEYGDGTTASGVKASETTVKGQHTFKKPGDYTTQAFLKFNVGNKTVTAPVCKVKVTVVNPFFSCVQLDGSILDKDAHKYRFVATMKYGNGAKFVAGSFDFGDGKSAKGVKSTDGKTVSVDHQYAEAGTYSIGATLTFDVNGKEVTAPTCRAVVTPTTKPTPECKPSIPVGDVRCNPCPYNPEVSADDTENCVVPKTDELPNTGAGNMVAIGGIALVGGFLLYRHMLFKRHKAAYLAADRGDSLLPLGDPLSPESPLELTPLATGKQRRHVSLRRRRQF